MCTACILRPYSRRTSKRSQFPFKAEPFLSRFDVRNQPAYQETAEHFFFTTNRIQFKGRALAARVSQMKTEFRLPNHLRNCFLSWSCWCAHFHRILNHLIPAIEVFFTNTARVSYESRQTQHRRNTDSITSVRSDEAAPPMREIELPF